MRKVTIYSTVGKKAAFIDTEATTWVELKGAMTEKGVDYSRMKAVIGETRHTLESDKAILPDGDFSLFLMPNKKIRSGATERQSLMEVYKSLGEGIKDFFKNKGVQVTRTSTNDIRDYIEEYKKSKKVVESDTPVKKSKLEKAKNAGKEAAKKVKDIAESDIEEFQKLLVKRVQKVMTMVDDAADIGNIEEEDGSKLLDELADIKLILELGGEEALERVKAERAEEERKKRMLKELGDMASDIANDFEGIDRSRM